MSNFAMAQVGINTPNPQGIFHIDGAKDNPVTGIPNGAQESNDLTVLSSGYVGIGTILPKQQLHIIEPNIVSAITNSFISGIAITGSGSAAGGATGPGFYLENVNAPVGSRLLKINYSMNSTEPILNFQRVTDNAGADAGGAAMVLARSGKLGINNIYNAANNLTVNGNASVGNAYVGIVAPTNGAIIQGRVGIGTSVPASSLDITAINPTGTTTNVEGLLIPRIDRQRAQSMTAVPNSTLVYINDISTGTAAGTAIDVTSTGYYYFDGTKWTAILSSANNSNSNWQLAGNLGTNQTTNFIGTLDNQNLTFKRNNIQSGFLGAINTAFGLSSLPPTSAAIGSTAFGINALGNTTGGVSGSAFGHQALSANISGSSNSAFGAQALVANITGASNTAVGTVALANMVSGGSNTAVGHFSLNNATGNFNTALGYASLIGLTTGLSNIGIGQNAGNEGTGGVSLTSGDGNIIIGRQASLQNGNNQLNIGSVLFGTGINGTLAARTGNIGIKTPNPQRTFHVDGAADNPITGIPTEIQQGNDVVISNTGNLSIGTNNIATARLHVVSENNDVLNEYHFDDYGGTTNKYNAFRIHKARGTVAAPANLQNGDHIGAIEFTPYFNNTASPYNNGTGLYAAYEGNGTNNLTSLRFFTSGNMPTTGERMRIDQNGNVGINTASPTTTLEVVTSNVNTGSLGIRFAGNNPTPAVGQNILVGFNPNTIAGGYAHWAIGSQFFDGTALGDADFIFKSSNGGTYVDRMIIKNGGNVGMGTNTPTQKLHVIGNILASGTITPSDIRIKKDITDNTYGLKEVLNLRTINYKYKDEELSKDKKIGFIAQEIKAAMPELVTTADDNMKTLGVNYAEMTVILTKAIQEQQIQINTLKKEIEELKKNK
ncbi:hypothetical protein ATE47_11950 [Chryseobacterium sp. IHB B 17019]|nr:hypothetical protein ATE47_11950 [Chryseobacterium sp. IHB B 17019]